MADTITAVEFFRHDLGQAELDEVARVFAGPILTTGEIVAACERQSGLDSEHIARVLHQFACPAGT